LSKQSENLLAQTSSPLGARALLVLNNGAVFEGFAGGAYGEVFGEIRFDTSMIGYENVISDPANAGTIIAMTYPQIGNYGLNLGDIAEGKTDIVGFAIHSLCKTPSNWRSEISLSNFLLEQGVVVIEGIDTRMLTQNIRDHGNVFAAISTEDLDSASLIGRLQRRFGDAEPKVSATVPATAAAAPAPAAPAAAPTFAATAPATPVIPIAEGVE